MFKKIKENLSKNFWIKNREVILILSLAMIVIYTIGNLLLILIDKI